MKIVRRLNNLILIVLLPICYVFTYTGCKDKAFSEQSQSHLSVSAADISSWPEIAESQPVFYDSEGKPISFLDILKESGINTIRLRLWVHPEDAHSGYNEVKTFAQSLRERGFKIWLTLHYSDTWADPGTQETPEKWRNISFEALTDSVYNYTRMVASELQPDFIRIGNEINNGFLHPGGRVNENFANFQILADTAITAVREFSPQSQIIMHYAGLSGAQAFFLRLSETDYDLIGLSYYPIWHGKSLNTLANAIENLHELCHKEVLIAETAYPFTMEWNDWTNNIVGLEEQLILPEFTATPKGQNNYLAAVKAISNDIPQYIGFCYWGGELIARKGNEATDGSVWENQALFDFDNTALPVLEEFRICTTNKN